MSLGQNLIIKLAETSKWRGQKGGHLSYTSMMYSLMNKPYIQSILQLHGDDCGGQTSDVFSAAAVGPFGFLPLA